MMLRSLLFLAILLLSACGTGAGGGGQAAQISPACALAESYLLSFPAVRDGGDIVLSDSNERVPEEYILLKWEYPEAEVSSLQALDGPLAELVPVLRAADGVSAVKVCANIRRILDLKGIRYGLGAVKESIRYGNLVNKSPILNVSLPVFSQDGKDSLLMYSYDGGALIGGGGILHLRRESDGVWKVIGRAMAWIA